MTVPQTYYQILQVHPAAPLELISNAYWRLVNRAQAVRRKESAADVFLYHLSRAYQTLSDPALRSQYDESIGLRGQSVAPDMRPVERSFLGRVFSGSRQFARKPDFYEILRLESTADAVLLMHAYEVMKNHYMRLVRTGDAPLQLILFLDEAYRVLSDPTARGAYDSERGPRRGAEPVAQLAAAGLATAAAAGAGAAVPRPPTPAATRPRQPRGSAAPVSPRPAKWSEGAPAGDGAPTRSSAQRPEMAVPDEATVDVVDWLLSALAAAARWLARAVVASVRWLATAVPAAVRGLARTSRSGAKWGRESLQAWREAAEEMAEQRELTRAPRIVAPEDELPGEEEALIARLRAGADGWPSRIEDFSMRAFLTLVHSPSGESSFEIDRSPLLLGADGHCDIPLPGMAPHEARLVYREGQFILFSLTDVQGIHLDGEAVAWAVLEDGTELQMGPYTLRFRMAAR